MPNLEDVGANAPKGEPGKGSPNPYRFELLAPMAMAALAKLRAQAADVHGDWTWRSAGAEVHFSKALTHMFAYMAGDKTESTGRPEEHLIHSLCRLMFAVDIQENERCIGDCCLGNVDVSWQVSNEKVRDNIKVAVERASTLRYKQIDAQIEHALARGDIRTGPFNKPPFGHNIEPGQVDVARYPERGIEVVVNFDHATINGIVVPIEVAQEMQRCMEKASRKGL